MHAHSEPDCPVNPATETGNPGRQLHPGDARVPFDDDLARVVSG